MAEIIEVFVRLGTVLSAEAATKMMAVDSKIPRQEEASATCRYCFPSGAGFLYASQAHFARNPWNPFAKCWENTTNCGSWLQCVVRKTDWVFSLSAETYDYKN